MLKTLFIVIPSKFNIAVFCCWLLSGCYYLQSTKVPIPTEYYPYQPPQRAEHLLILLPGIAAGPELFIEHGFDKALHDHGYPMDVMTVEAHFKYYQERSVLDRLREDVIEPAQQQGYQSIHLAGTSLGGYGALLYLREYPQQISSVTLIAPYLGEEEAYQNYQRSLTDSNVSLEEGNVWPWLYDLDTSSKAKIFLGYGTEDRFAERNKRLQKILSGNHTQARQGNHNWETWRTLWDDLLQSSNGFPKAQR